MISDHTYTLVAGLLEKTKAGEAPWAEPSDLFATLFKGFIRLDLPRSAVTIGRMQNNTIQFRIHNSEGTAIIDENAKLGERGYDEMREILEIAIRRSRKIDETLGDLHDFLKTPGKKIR